ncbi:MAG: hypothetical protein ABIN95_03065, partial [Mucilaginibacter sp.]
NPTNTEIFIIDHKTIEVPKTIISLKKWNGFPIANTFGGKGLIDFDGTPMFAELAILKIFNLSGWNARWIETYGAKPTSPYHFSNWLDCKLTEQPVDMITDENVMQVMNSMSNFNNNTFAGCWDIIGWLDNKIVFAELKRSKKDRLRNSQYNWLSAGLNHGLTSSNFLIVEWDYIETSF